MHVKGVVKGLIIVLKRRGILLLVVLVHFRLENQPIYPVLQQRAGLSRKLSQLVSDVLRVNRGRLFRLTVLRFFRFGFGEIQFHAKAGGDGDVIWRNRDRTRQRVDLLVF